MKYKKLTDLSVSVVEGPRGPLTWLLVCATFLSLHAQVQRAFSFSHHAMGTQFGLQLYAIDSVRADSVVRLVFARIDSLEASMSDYRTDSELNRLRGSTKWQKVSLDLWVVLRFSRRVARRSKGAFDPTVGPLTKVWRRAFRRQEFPTEAQVQAARTQVQWKELKVTKPARVRLRREDMALDLGGVAKGYALDIAGQMLRQAGYPAFLLDGGGDLLLGDAPPGKAGWVVATANGQSLGLQHNIAIATSGATYRYLEYNGVRYSHLIDPRTGYGITGHKLVTVTGPRATVADALASALSVDTGKWTNRFRAYTYRISRKAE